MTCFPALSCGHGRPIRRARSAIPEDLRFCRFLAVFAGHVRVATYRDITSQVGSGTITQGRNTQVSAVSRHRFILLD